MTETPTPRTPLEIPADRAEKTQLFLEEIAHTFTTTGTITQTQLGNVIRSIELSESLLEATATFVNVADKTVATLESALIERDEEIAEKDREIAALSIQLRDKERDLELANTDA